MPMKARTPCLYPGCRALASHRGRCPEHARTAERDDRTLRGSSAQRGYNYDWRKARRQYLDAHPLCVKCLEEKVTTAATVVDHIIPHRGDQSLFWDEANWQPLCKRHHDQKTVSEGGIVYKRDHRVTIVCGPPGSGKTTHVQMQMRPGDLVVDLDAIREAISFQPWYTDLPQLAGFAAAARDAIIAELAKQRGVAAWVITTEPDPARRASLRQALDADVLIMAVPAKRCIERIRNDERRSNQAQRFAQAVDEWWRLYRPGPGEQVMGGG